MRPARAIIPGAVFEKDARASGCVKKKREENGEFENTRTDKVEPRRNEIKTGTNRECENERNVGKFKKENKSKVVRVCWRESDEESESKARVGKIQDRDSPMQRKDSPTRKF